MQQLAHFFVAGLGKILVPLTDRPEWFGSHRTNHFVHFGLELGTGLGGGHRYGYDDLGWLFLAEGEGSNSHGGSSRQAIVYQNDCAPAHIERRTAVAVLVFPALEFSFFFRGYSVNYFWGKTKALDDIVIQHAYSTRCNRPHG
jgi:hypothetical protein